MGKAIERMSCLEAKAPEDLIFGVGGVANIKSSAGLKTNNEHIKITAHRDL